MLTPVQLGTIDSVVQLPEPGYARVGAHRLGIELWPGRAIAAGLKLGAGNHFDDVWLLSAAGEAEAASLIVAPALAVPGVRAVLRAGAHEQPIRLTGLLGSGPGYERYGFVTDRADGAAAPGA